LIDASGQAAFIARQRDWLRLDPDFRFVSLWGYFLGSSFVSSGGLVRPFEDLKSYLPMTFVSQLEGWGWSWHIPLRETTSVGLNVQVDQYKRDIARHSSLESYFLATCASAKYLDELLSPATLMKGSVSMIRDYSYSIKQVAGPGYFIVGDAAGFVDPIFSLGVVMALYSGHLAAWAADRSLANPKQAHFNLQIFERALSGRRALARAMALPSETVEVNANAQTYFEFFSHDERELMWAAASMTTRSANIAAASGDRRAKPLKRRELSRLQGA
jgi:flavin-dependent dehydrogenase